MEAVSKLPVPSEGHQTTPWSLVLSFKTQSERDRIWYRSGSGWASRPRTELDRARTNKVIAGLSS